MSREVCVQRGVCLVGDGYVCPGLCPEGMHTPWIQSQTPAPGLRSRHPPFEGGNNFHLLNKRKKTRKKTKNRCARKLSDTMSLSSLKFDCRRRDV